MHAENHTLLSLNAKKRDESLTKWSIYIKSEWDISWLNNSVQFSESVHS